jgi:hypothetical protein
MCRLRPGERIEYRFESTEPVDFNIHTTKATPS